MQRVARGWQRAGVRVGFVPTMGYLHAGHLSLVRRARRLVGRRGKVVVSIYVNPTQFGPQEDLSRVSAGLWRATPGCAGAEGVDVIFAPHDEQMYPRTPGFSTFVVEEDLARGMEGKSRPTHFRGVTTVVAKLFNIVQPDVAVFGAKDYQQAAIVKRMVRDLNFPLKIVVAPIAARGGRFGHEFAEQVSGRRTARPGAGAYGVRCNRPGRRCASQRGPFRRRASKRS